LRHGRRDVAVMVEGRRYRRMPKPLLGEFRMYRGERRNSFSAKFGSVAARA
jgi:hypothetical protein